MITTMMMMSMILFVVAAAKKVEPRWIQMTLTSGAPKGAVDWLKPNTKIRPTTIRYGTAASFRTDGFHIPDFVDDGAQCLIIIDANDVGRRPLLIHQKTALITTLIWMSQRAYSMEDSGGDIETIHTDEPWELNYRRGKGKFDPYTMAAQDLSDGAGGPA
jgi:hypothetical protein